MPEFVKVAQAADIRAGQAKQIEAGGKAIALFNVDGSYYAIDDTCPHVGGPLSEGEVTGKIVACPWHGATFDLTNGETTGGPAANPVSCFKVRVTGDTVEIEI